LPNWEEIFPAIPPAQQRTLLALAADQGYLHACQIPPTCPPATDRPRIFINELLAVKGADLKAPDFPPLTPLDAELDAEQRDAVIKAVHTPDVALIQGLPGTGKTRVAVEIARQAVQRGQRVLLVSPIAATLDHALERLALGADTMALRCLGRDERADQLPPVAAAFTFAALCDRLGRDAIAMARQGALAADARVNNRIADDAVYNQLDDLADAFARHATSLAEFQQRQENIEADVESSPDVLAMLENASRPFRERLEHVNAERQRQATLAGDLHTELTGIDQQLSAVMEIISARDHFNPFSLRSWRAKLAADTDKQRDELSKQQEEKKAALEKCHVESERLEQTAREIDAAWNNERLKLIAEAIGQCRVALADVGGSLARERDRLSARWRDLGATLHPGSPMPAEATRAAIEAAREGCRRQLEADRRAAELTHRWADTLAEHSAGIPAQLLQDMQIVAVPYSALNTDAQLAELNRRPFDLLIVEDAHRLSEPEFLAVARRANRWVLIGEPGGVCVEEPSNRPAPRTPDRRPSTHRRPPPAPAKARTSLFARLWQRLHADIWGRERGRLCCRLRSMPPELHAKMTREAVADCPEIEVCFDIAHGTPELSEVCFPDTTPISRAVAFVFNELNELPIIAPSENRWHHEHRRLVWRLAGAATDNLTTVELTPGIRAEVGPEGVTALMFDDHDLSRATDWVQAHVRRVDSGRTASLRTPHRMRPELAEFLNRLSLGETYRVRPTAVSVPIVEFLPVTRRSESLPNGHVKRGGHSPPRGGAGLEIDLSDPHQRDSLPAELRPIVSGTGVVNLDEADAILELLKRLIATITAGRPASLGVIPLYADQAAVIRHRLMRQASDFQRPGVTITVASPLEFRPTDCDLAIVGLTRSHRTHAVPFGDDPQALVRAISRARRQIWIVGDPGTLARRAVWEGSLPHRDDESCRRERAVAAELARRFPPDSLRSPPSLQGLPA
jgi:hypothetical protein